MPIDNADTAFILASAGLVFLMIGGVAFLEAGLVKAKNASSIIMKVFGTMIIVTIVWVIAGFSLAFAPTQSGLIGGLDFLGLKGIGAAPLENYAPTIPGILFMLYQGMFAAITVALISGAVAERMKFSSWLLFSAVWAILVYAPLAHWVWGGGWLGALGVVDFAGGIVVHISAGFAALAAGLVLGRRKGFGRPEAMAAHNIPWAWLGVFILWFGWFGFNGGSALGSSVLAVTATVATNLAAAAAALSVALLSWFRNGKPSTIMTLGGSIAGLAAITPASGFVGPMPALLIGLVAGILFYGGVIFVKEHLKIDDALDVSSIHGITGIWGAVATGLFANKIINSGGPNGLFFGNASQLGIQILGAAVGAVFAFVVTYAILKVLDSAMKIRITPKEEELGEDLALHNEKAYN